jgi:alkanesulfonate monooxygenase SsuD/methylene tetrahydromethanopterin reductase-like flavin-dependent oxidoreductase (luciferase family)
MAALAGGTKRLKFGMNVVSVALRDPLLLAKQCATVDFLSNGRILPAFGVGSNFSPEWKATGRPTKGRGLRTDEGLEIISRLWSEESFSFDGTYYQYDNVRINPQPLQKELPLWLGGDSEAAIRRTARFGTGWIAGLNTPAEAGRVVKAIKAAVKEEGRKIDDDHYGAGFFYRFGSWEDEVCKAKVDGYGRLTGKDPRQYLAIGDAEDLIGRIREFIEHGVMKFVLLPITAGAEDTLAQTRLLMDEVLPEVENR